MTGGRNNGNRPGRRRANVILTGFMGTGKSAAGRVVARRLDENFVDLDTIIEREAGRVIADIFAEDGEARFRELERGVIQRLVKGDYGSGLVVSTGGGAVVDPATRALLKGWGVLVCLTATVDEIMKRVGGTSKRPLLNRADARVEAERLMAERSEAYAECHATIDTTGLTLDEVAGKVIEAVDKASAG